MNSTHARVCALSFKIILVLSFIDSILSFAALNENSQKGFWICDVKKVVDQDAYDIYKSKLKELFVDPPDGTDGFKAAILWDGPPTAIVGDVRPDDVFVLEFESLEKAIAFKTNPTYVDQCEQNKPIETIVRRDIRLIESDQGLFRKLRSYSIAFYQGIVDQEKAKVYFESFRTKAPPMLTKEPVSMKMANAAVAAHHLEDGIEYGKAKLDCTVGGTDDPDAFLEYVNGYYAKEIIPGGKGHAGISEIFDRFWVVLNMPE